MSNTIKTILIAGITAGCLGGLNENPKGAVMVWLLGVAAVEIIPTAFNKQ